jgi:hypothetical protein
MVELLMNHLAELVERMEDRAVQIITVTAIFQRIVMETAVM